MLWAEEIAELTKTRFSDRVAQGKPIIIRDEKTASGRVHVGSLRGVAIHGMVSEVLTKMEVPNSYLFEINDFDPMDGLPVYLDKAIFEPYMGKPLCEVPSPDGKAKNFAEFYGQEFVAIINEIGYTPTVYRSSEMYRSGKYNDAIRAALDNAKLIRGIYLEVSGSQKSENWLPLSVICENCGKVGTTRVMEWDGEKVSYRCDDYVKWAHGCGHQGVVSPFDGRAKLPWKVEWAAKFTVLDVCVEGGGKDHSTRGGSRDIADHISQQVFKREPPINIPYEFIQISGKKMSSSKGAGASAREVADLLPPHMVRLLMLQKDPVRTVDFIPDGDTVPILYDSYDKFAENYWSGTKDDFSRLFEYIHIPNETHLLEKRYLPRFSQVAYLVQMPHVDAVKEFTKLAGRELSAADIAELSLRQNYAKIWLDTYAPEDYRFEIQEKVPEAALRFTAVQKSALKKVLEYVRSQKELDGQGLHTAMHDIKNGMDISPKEFFAALYLSILGKESGPKAGWFLSVLDKKFLEKRLDEVIK